MEIKPHELRQIVWNQMGKRVSPSTSTDEMHALLRYESDEFADNPMNKMRDEIMQFIGDNASRLSLPCDGNCYEHTDAVVMLCHKQLMEDNDGREEGKADQEDV